VMLFGHSWGGYAVAAVLNDDPNITAVASISGFNSPIGLLYEQTRLQLGPLATVEVPFGWLYQALLFGKDASVTGVDGINRTDIPVMLIHGTADEAISYNGASIIAQRAAITNSNVVYKAITAENKNNHDQLFRSDAAIQYIAAKNEEYRALSARYNGDIPQAELDQFYGNIDRFKTSELDPDFMNSINQFYEMSLESMLK
jgi:alpha-beta hydrolase superfamily lysophospholipase